MIEKIKYHLSQGQMRLKSVALFTALTVAVVTLINCSIHTTKIFDGQKTYTVRGYNKNLAMVMANVNLKSDNYKILNSKTQNNVTSVEISYTFPVYVTQGDNTYEIEFTKGTVKEALDLAGFTPDEFDFVEPSLDTVITETAYIDFTDISFVSTTAEEVIPFATEKINSRHLKKGVTQTVNEGKNGLKLITYNEKFVNGLSTEKTVSSTQVLANPVNKKVLVGTQTTPKPASQGISTLKPATPIELDQNGVPVNYKSKMTVRATAYTYTGNKCSTGVAPQPGYIAVNPKVIPYGTKMYIKTVDGSYIYGYAIAADTGGFIKKHPTGVDLFLSSESACQKFGVRAVEIYILN